MANNLALVADNAFLLQSHGELSMLMSWMGAIAFTLQIYFDFSGYSDMAIGLGKMFGFELPENFNYPYISLSISEFWRRWHMTLQIWFRDYVYIPMGGNRVSQQRWFLNVFVVWLLTGIWHGANWTFIVWGLMYFFLLLIEKTGLIGHLPGFVKHVYTLLFVCIGWVVFKASSLPQAFSYISTMFTPGSCVLYDGNALLYLKEYAVFFVVGIAAATPLFRFLNGNRWVYIRYLCLAIIWFIAVSYIVRGAYNPFIYFNF